MIEPVLDFIVPFADEPGFHAGGVDVSLGSAGHVIGRLNLVADDFSSSFRVIFHDSPGSAPRIILKEGDLIDPAHPDMQWQDADEFYVSESGFMAMRAKVNDPSKSAFPLWAVVGGQPSELKVIVYDGQRTEPLLDPLGYVSGVQLNSSGLLSFLLGGSIWFNSLDESARPVVAGKSDPDPPYPGMPAGSAFGSAFTPSLLNASGALFFSATIENPEDSGNYTRGFWVKNDDGLRPFLNEGDQAPPEFPGATISLGAFRSSHFFSDSGWCGMKALHAGSPGGIHDGQAIYAGVPGNRQLVVHAGMTTPEIPGGTFGPDFLFEGISNDGEVFFRNQIHLPSGETPDSYWRWTSGQLRLTAMKGQSVPEFQDGTLDGLKSVDQAGISPGGAAIFRARSSGSPENAVFIQEQGSQAIRRVIGDGDAFPAIDGAEGTVSTVILSVPSNGPRFDARGRFLAAIDGFLATDPAHRRHILAWVNPGSSAIRGGVYIDINGDGDPADATEGIAGVRIMLKNHAARERVEFTTGENGQFSFTGLVEGNYSIGADLGDDREDYFWTSPPPVIFQERYPRYARYAILEGSVPALDGITFLAARKGKVEGVVEDGDNPQAGLAGARIRLLRADNGSKADGTDTVTTSADGDFFFSDVKPGNYVIEETDPPGYQSVTDTDPPGFDNQIRVSLASGADSTGHKFTDRRALYSISLHRVSGEKNGIANLLEPTQGEKPQKIESILPVTNPSVLNAQPFVTNGLVADGVTPLLIKFAAAQLTEPFTVRWNCEAKSGGSVEDLDVHGLMSVRGESGWEPAGKSDNVATRTPDQNGVGFEFALIRALEPEKLWLADGSKEVELVFSLIADDEANDVVAEKSIMLRRSPSVPTHWLNRGDWI